MEKGTIYIPEFCNSSFGEQSPAYCLSLIFAAQKSLLIDYSALIRLSLRISPAVAHSSMFGHKPRQCFKGSFYFFHTKAAKHFKPQQFNRSLVTYLLFLLVSKISAE